MSNSDEHLEEITAMGTNFFQKTLSNNNAMYEPVKSNDLHALGVIDVFAKNLKKVLSNDFKKNQGT